jgi:hypothetical protein
VCDRLATYLRADRPALVRRSGLVLLLLVTAALIVLWLSVFWQVGTHVS